MVDIGDTLAPKSEQMDAIDLLSGPRIFTVARVAGGDDEQPINIHLAEFPRPWRPGVTMRRLLFKLWGGKGQEYVGRQVELYNDESVRFGPDQTGGIRIRSLSHIGTKPVTVTLPASKGKYGKWTVQPLTERSVKEPDVLGNLWRKISAAGIPKDQAKEFMEGAIGHELTKAADVTEAEAQEVTDNFDALLAAWITDGGAA